jgi:hypothetical protein
VAVAVEVEVRGRELIGAEIIESFGNELETMTVDNCNGASGSGQALTLRGRKKSVK